ncbi:MAG: ABC transporter substrate-binding protein, partial [Calditrichia bacterium]
SREQIEDLQRKHRDKTLDGAVTVIEAKKMIAGGNIDRGENILNDFLGREPHHFYAAEARALLSGTVAAGVENSFIYFKPADGELKEIADQIQQGMLYAIRESQIRNEDIRINFEAVELEESEVSALLTGEEKIKARNPVCMIGPIDANQCAGFSVLSRYEKRPYIIPLSSGTGFTRLSPYAFQLNPDVETKGRFFGEYAVTELEHKKIAVLAPVNEYGKGFVRSFVEAVQANGGEIVTDQWYYLDTQDFTRQFKAIRKKSFQIEFEKYLQDSVEVDTTWSEDDLREQYQIFMEQKFEDIQFGQDSTQIPATGIDAILIVTTPAFVPYLASQFAFHNIESDILGNEGWNDPEQLKKFQQNVEGLVYVTASYFDPESWNYKEFMNRFRMQMNETPLFYHLLGYDMMKWILQNYKPGMSPEELKSKLENSELYNGIVENIKFSNKPRVNDQLKVIKFSFGHFIQLK